VARLKYRNQRASLGFLATGMAALVEPAVGGDATVTWVPTTPRRRRHRGFDQAELLARAVASTLGLSCRAMLRRTGDHTQTGHTLAERLTGPQLVARRVAASGPVLLVDDVCTSGASLSAGAFALKAASVPRVDGLTAALALRNHPPTTQGGRPA
jgi:predicted amidophosphoribosyltransferase